MQVVSNSFTIAHNRQSTSAQLSPDDFCRFVGGFFKYIRGNYMDLGLFSAKIEIQIKELPEVTFFCTRPRLEDMETSSSATSKRIKNLWENHVKDWIGIEKDDLPFDCTTENKRELLKINSLLVLAVCNKLAETWTSEFNLESGN